MNTDDTFAQAKPLSHESKYTPPPPRVAPPLAHPAPVMALERIEGCGRAYHKSSEKRLAVGDLGEVAAKLVASVTSDEDMETKLRIQSCLLDSAFNTLMLMTTTGGYFDTLTFKDAIRAQRQYRMNWQSLHQMKNLAEQTERLRAKSTLPPRGREGR